MKRGKSQDGWWRMRIENIYDVQILIAEETLRGNEFKLFFFEKSENLY